MAFYTIIANNISQQTPKLAKGPIRIHTEVPVYVAIGENPTASPKNCMIMRAGEVKELRFPVSCSKVAVVALNQPGQVTVTEEAEGVSSSCSR